MEGEHRYDAVVRAASRTVVGLDFDGTLSPIVDDPTEAHIHPDASDVLVALAAEVAGVAVITGRPARQVLDLGGLYAVGDAMLEAGTELHVYGQYGNEHWKATSRRIVGPRPPSGLASFERELPRALRTAGLADAYVEDKGLAVAVHTRRMDEPDAAFTHLVPVLAELAERHHLTIEPGRQVVEVRSPGMHKGLVVQQFHAELDADGFVFAGDDLGDVEAFEAVGDLAKEGRPTLLVCSASDEQSALRTLADVVVPGPDGVLDLLRKLTADVRAARS